MNILLRNSIPLFAVVALAASPIVFSSSAHAGSCDGVVRGLSKTYNAKTGSGFLAVRQRPTSRSRKVGELFNGNRVELYSKRGKWYEVDNGWAFARYIRTSCDPNNP